MQYTELTGSALRELFLPIILSSNTGMYWKRKGEPLNRKHPIQQTLFFTQPHLSEGKLRPRTHSAKRTVPERTLGDQQQRDPAPQEAPGTRGQRYPQWKHRTPKKPISTYRATTQGKHSGCERPRGGDILQGWELPAGKGKGEREKEALRDLPSRGHR